MNTTQALVQKMTTYVIDPLMLILFACGFFLFMFGMVEFLFKKSRGQDSPEGKNHMIYGVIGMLIMVSVGGIIGFLVGTFGIDISGNSIDTSSVNGAGQSIFFPG
ncbi:hypothetical protein HZC00_00895 [Candidatus Kaiserbacteria bacterium]|nr:hypothetical protein [Candidatus Kaiserbacteria bacterium]